MDSWFVQDDSLLKTSFYDACEATFRDFMECISHRNQQQRNSLLYSQSNVKARQLLKKFIDDSTGLEEDLKNSRQMLTEGEYQRRLHLLDELKSKKIKMEIAFHGKDESGNRSTLMGLSLVPRIVNMWGDEEESDTRELTIDDMRGQQLLAIEEQDKGLDALHNVVVRQKLMAQNIGQEIDLHNEILDDITDHTDRTRERLIRETRHVTIVDRKSNTCGYWIVIVLLFMAIVAIVCVP